MTRVIGLIAFWTGALALVAMLALDILDIAEIEVIWFTSLALVLTAASLLVPALRTPSHIPNRFFGYKKRG